jgi:hypothetical protein
MAITQHPIRPEPIRERRDQGRPFLGDGHDLATRIDEIKRQMPDLGHHAASQESDSGPGP